MHAVLALIHSHHRYLLGESIESTPIEQHQISRALACYNARLSSSLTAEDADALLATSTLINAFSFASISTTDPAKSWPLVSSPTNLQWLAVQQGPALIMAASTPWLAQSVFFSTFSDFELDATAISTPELQDDPLELLPDLLTTCGV